MSASSIVSSRSSAWRLKLNPPPRIQSIMDSIFAIAFGLGLRFVVDIVSRHDAKVTGTLVGLWEGIILLHFLKKMPKSTDPYIAYAVRLVIDLVWTAEGDDALARLVLVLIWTALGMVLADIAPPLWVDTGLARVWRRLRRDLYTLSRMVPAVAFFPPARTVRFSPPRPLSDVLEEPSVLGEDVSSPPPSDVTPLTTTDAFPLSTATPSQPTAVARRRLPGHFPSDTSEADSDISSVRAGRHERPSTTAGRTSRRLSVYPQYADSVSDDLDLDDANLSSRTSDSQSDASTERGDEVPQGIDPRSIPDMLADEEPALPLTLDTTTITTTVTTSTTAIAEAAASKPEDPTTPRAGPTYLPPTPSDSAWRQPHLRGEPSSAIDPLPVRPNLGMNVSDPSLRPQSAFLPQIPDFLEEAATEDWEAIQPAEYASKPPTPPAKDGVGAVPARYSLPRLSSGTVPPVTAIPLVVPPLPSMPPPVPVPDSMHTRALSKQDEEWEGLKSQFVAPAATSDQPPPEAPRAYKDSSEFDDIYGDEYVSVPSAVPAPAPADDSVPVGDLLMSDSPSPRGDENEDATAAADKGQHGADGGSTLPPLGAPFSLNFGQQGGSFGGFGGTTAATGANPWGKSTGTDDPFEAFQKQQLEDEQRMKDAWLRAQEEERRRLAEEEEARLVMEKVYEEERKREEEEGARLAEEKKRKEEEKAERKRKEEEDELARRKKFEEEEARRIEEEEAQRKKEKEEAEEEEARRIEEEEAQRKKEKEEAAAQVKREKEEKKAKREEAKRLKEEEARRAQEEAEEREREEKRLKQEAKEKKRKEAEEAAERRAKAQEEKERAEKEKAEKEAEEAAAAAVAAAAEAAAAAAKAEAQRQAEAEAAAVAQAAKEQEEREREEEATRLAQDAVITSLALALESASPSAEGQENTEAEAQAGTPVDGHVDASADAAAAANANPEEEQLGTSQATPKDNLRELDDLLRTPVIGEGARALDADPLRTPAGGADVPLSGALADTGDNADDAAGEAHDDNAQDAPGSPALTESVMSEASVMPDKAADRLDRLLLGKAQMVETQEIIDRVKKDLLAGTGDEAALKDELKRTEKILRKMQKKEQRRYEQGVATHSTYDASESTDLLDYGNCALGTVGTMTQEKLELLLGPGVKSLTLDLKMAVGKKSSGVKQKQKVSQILDDFGLLDYSRDAPELGRGLHVHIPEERFDKWLRDYRAATTGKDNEDDGWH